ncbi:hypothetical protein DPMN_131099 [Dreissena polymorpha]|uniref:Uncharacterized protein n=1 Tax=Dreissena polymorpha TaxID=45954 RepID=A0A9D4H406_DREPO|nr:hypothetical protein DPMN_131099 [Dreissena polymorpha]
MSKFHEDNVSSRLFTCFHFIHIKKTAPPPGAYVFPPITIIFKLVRDIHIANVLTKFHDDKAKNVTSRVPPPGGHVFLSIQTIFELNCRNQVWYCVNRSRDGYGGHVFQPTGIIFKLVQDIIGVNVLTKKNAPPLGSHFYEDWTINMASRVLTRKNAPPPGGHVFQPTGIIFELVQDIIGVYLLTKFHEDWAINVVSIVKNAPPLDSHVFQANVTIFELTQDIINTNLLTEFHEDWTINANVDVAQRTTDKRRSQKLTMSTLCSRELNKKRIN